MDTGATQPVLKLIKCVGSIKTDMSLELLALNIKLLFSQGLLNVKEARVISVATCQQKDDLI